jgi:hypothetical protein
MPNKYNLGAINVEFNPTTIKQNNMIVLEIGDSYKKEPVIQIADNNDIQLLYYYGRIFIYMLGGNKFFVIEMTSEKSDEIYFMFDVEAGSKTPTHDNSSIGRLLNALNGTENKSTTLGLELNSELKVKDQKIQRSGNIFYVKNIKVSGLFPLADAAKTTFLPPALKNMTSAPTEGTVVQFVQEEIQWVLDCQHESDYGRENTDLSGDKTAFTYFISGIAVCVGFLLVYLFIIYIWPAISKKNSTGGPVGSSPPPTSFIAKIGEWITSIWSSAVSRVNNIRSGNLTKQTTLIAP